MALLADPVRPSWADDDEDDIGTPHQPSTTVLADGTKIIVEYRTRDDGKKVKITRKIKPVLVHRQEKGVVADRKKLKKFGDSFGAKPGPEASTTSIGEKVFLKLSTAGRLDEQEANPSDVLKQQISKAKIMCRICKGDHWTTKCPFKDTHQPLDEIAPENKEVPNTATPPADGAPSTGKYIPPSMRAGASRAGESMKDRRDDLATIRITNLSEDTTEQDVADLVKRFGPTSRVFVARDRELNICKGFAFVSYYDKEHAERAMAKLDGFGYDNLILKVEWARSNKD